MKYGLTQDDCSFVDAKIAKQKKFLSDFIIDIFDKDFSLLDSCLSPNITPHKYFAEVNNRVNSLAAYAKDHALYPVFLTITCPPRFHKNSRDYDGSTVKDSVSYLSASWASFLRLKVFKHIKKDNPMPYIRVLEPHKDGTPHSHVLLWIPKSYILSVKKVFQRHFSRYGASRNAHSSAFKYVWHSKQGGAVAYILKYINKTFKSATNDVMGLEAYYYALHSIRRFTTSQTLVPLYFFRKVRHDERFRNFLTVTRYWHSKRFYVLMFGKAFVFRSPDFNDVHEEIIYERSPALDALRFDKYQKAPKKIIKYVAPPLAPCIPVYIDGQKFVWNYKELIKPIPKPLKMKDSELLSYFNSLDPKIVHYAHFLHVRDVCIERGLLKGELRPKTVLYDPEIAQYYFNNFWSEYVF